MPSPATKGRSGPRLLADREHADREVTGHDRGAGFGERRARRAGAGGEVEDQLARLRVDQPRRPACASAGPARATARRWSGRSGAATVVEHPRDVVRLLVQSGSLTGISVATGTVGCREQPRSRHCRRPGGPAARGRAPSRSTIPGRCSLSSPDDDHVAWVHRGDGLVGWGRAAEFTHAGPNRFLDAASWWREITRHSVVRDDVDVPGSGLVAFGAFTFDDDGDGSAPDRPGGRRRTPGRPRLGHHHRRRHHRRHAAHRRHRRPGPTAGRAVHRRPGRARDAWKEIVAEAVRRISRGGISKVVLARDLVADLGRAARRPRARSPGSPSTTPAAGRSTSTASSARRRRCSCASSADW